MSRNLLDLPNEIIIDVLFKYLGPIEIFALGETGNRRLKQLSEDSIGYSKGIFYIKTSVYINKC